MVKKGAWSLAKLKDICGFIGGGTPSKEIEDFWCGNIPWIATLDKGKHDKQQKNGLSTLPKTPPGCKKGGVFA